MKTETSILKAGYNDRADVLYIISGVPVVSQSQEGDDGVEFDFAVDSGKPFGVTVVGFNENGWRNRIGFLADITSRHLDVDALLAMDVIETAIVNGME